MAERKIAFSEKAHEGISKMRDTVMEMFAISKDAFEHLNKKRLPELGALEDSVDNMKKELVAAHFARLAEGNCDVNVSPYYSSVVARLERVADHLVNVGYSIVNPTGSENQNH